MSQGKKCLKKTKELQFFLKDKLHGIVTDLKKDTPISTVNQPISTVNQPISPQFVKRLVSFVYFFSNRYISLNLLLLIFQRSHSWIRMPNIQFYSKIWMFSNYLGINDCNMLCIWNYQWNNRWTISIFKSPKLEPKNLLLIKQNYNKII